MQAAKEFEQTGRLPTVGPQQPQQKHKPFNFSISDEVVRKNIYEMICDIEKAWKFIDNFVDKIEKNW